MAPIATTTEVAWPSQSAWDVASGLLGDGERHRDEGGSCCDPGEAIDGELAGEPAGRKADPDDRQADAEVGEHIQGRGHVRTMLVGCELADGRERSEKSESVSGSDQQRADE